VDSIDDDGYDEGARRRDARRHAGERFSHDGHHLPPSSVAAFGRSDVIAGYVRLMTIVASIIGPVLLGIGSWAAGQAWSAFQQQRDKTEEIRLTINTMVAERKAADASVTQAWEAIRSHDARLLDHERRLTRLEAVAPIAPLLREQSK
jgi:hypothetical protein